MKITNKITRGDLMMRDLDNIYKVLNLTIESNVAKNMRMTNMPKRYQLVGIDDFNYGCNRIQKNIY